MNRLNFPFLRSSPQSSEEDPSSAFRARLRPRKDPVRTAPRISELGSASLREDLFRGLNRQEPLSYGRAQPPATGEHDVVVALRDALANAGCELYSEVATKLVSKLEDVEGNIAALASQFSMSSDAIDALFNNIQLPLSSTLCSFADLPEGTIAEHLSRLKDELATAETKLATFRAAHDACIVEEKDIWRALQAETVSVDKKEGERLKKEASRISRDAVKAVDEIEKEYRDNVQAETLTMMQAMAMD